MEEQRSQAVIDEKSRRGSRSGGEAAEVRGTTGEGSESGSGGELGIYI